MIQLELFPEPIPDTPVASARFWEWLDRLAEPQTKEISFREMHSDSKIICSLTDHTVRIETIQ